MNLFGGRKKSVPATHTKPMSRATLEGWLKVKREHSITHQQDGDAVGDTSQLWLSGETLQKALEAQLSTIAIDRDSSFGYVRITIERLPDVEIPENWETMFFLDDGRGVREVKAMDISEQEGIGDGSRYIIVGERISRRKESAILGAERRLFGTKVEALAGAVAKARAEGRQQELKAQWCERLLAHERTQGGQE